MAIKLKIIVDEKQERAYLIIDDNLKEATKEDIYQNLALNNVIAGINDQVIDDILAGRRNSSDKVVVAQIIKPQAGKDGFFKYLISDEVEMKTAEDGHVDFYDAGLIKNVKKGEKLVEIIPPTTGKTGSTLDGKEIAGLLGEKAPYHKILGEGIRLDDDARFLIAEREGVYKKNPIGLIAVVEELNIKGDLDFGVGNIDTGSTVLVGGDIKAGFKCHSKSSIKVEGVIEDAEVGAEQNLICKLGILPGEESIFAKESIRAKYIRNRKLVEAKRIYIEEMISSSNIKSLGEVEAKKIAGGRISVMKRIQCQDLGNEQFTLTEVEAGVNYKVMERMHKNREELDSARKEYEENHDHKNDLEIELKKINRKLGNLSGNTSSNAIAEKIKGEVKEITQKINILNSKCDNLLRTKDRLEKEYQRLSKKIEDSNPEIIVRGNLYRGVTIKLKTSGKLVIEEDFQSVKVVYDDMSRKVKITAL